MNQNRNLQFRGIGRQILGYFRELSVPTVDEGSCARALCWAHRLHLTTIGFNLEICQLK